MHLRNLAKDKTSLSNDAITCTTVNETHRWFRGSYDPANASDRFDRTRTYVDRYRWITFSSSLLMRNSPQVSTLPNVLLSVRVGTSNVARCYAIVDTVLDKNGRGRAAATSSRFYRAVIDHVRPFGKRSEIDAGWLLNETLYPLISPAI